MNNFPSHAEMAVLLEQAFDVEAEFWLDLQKKYDIRKVQECNKIHIDRILASAENHLIY